MMPSEDFLDYLKTVNQTFYDQIRMADQKAAYVFTFLIAILIWSSDMRQVFFWVNTPPTWTVRWFLSISFAASLIFALICAALVILPRDESGGVSLYWGAWPKAGDRLVPADDSEDRSLIVDEYKTNINCLAAICRRKYRFVGLAFRGLIATILCHILLAMIGK